MGLSPRFFVSFSSKDLKYVREIMAALKGQDLEVWDYSDIIESIEFGEIISERLIREIDQCSHMVVLISSNSIDPVIGRFCRIEIEHAIKRKLNNKLILLPVIIGDRKTLESHGFYKEFEQYLSHDFKLTPESIVEFTVRVCQVIGKLYLPPIVAHPNLPFREFLRIEISEMAHSNKNHTDLLILIGEFNEYYRQENQDIHRALFLINYFILSCEYKMVNYTPFYPWIVKAVCETELGMFEEAMNSYEKAKTIHPDNQDVIGGIGTVYFNTKQYQKAIECFELIIKNNLPEDISNAKINLIIIKQSTGAPINEEEESFLFNLNTDQYSDDLKTKILNAQATQYLIKKNYPQLEKHCKIVISKNLHDTFTIQLFQLSYLNRGMNEAARQVIKNALDESVYNERLNAELLNTFPK